MQSLMTAEEEVKAFSSLAHWVDSGQTVLV